jgi:hypothetical protein
MKKPLVFAMTVTTMMVTVASAWAVGRPRAVVVEGKSDLVIRVARSTHPRVACLVDKPGIPAVGSDADCMPFKRSDGRLAAIWRGRARHIRPGKKIMVFVTGGSYGGGHTYTLTVVSVPS